MQIRKYRDSDKNQVVDLWKTIFPDPAPRNEPTRVIDLKLAVDDLLLVAIEDENIIGTTMAGYDGHRGWLYSVAIDPKYQRKGVGRELVNKAIELLKDLGCIKVNIQILSTNTEVVAFYEAIGFKFEERISMGKLLTDENNLR